VRVTAPSPAVSAGAIRTRDASLRRRRRARLTARGGVLLTLIVSVLALSVAPAQMYFEQTAELARFEKLATALERKNGALAAREELLRDQAFLERLARQCLGMVKPGEIAFVVVPKEGAPAPPPEC
jgi:cell division protein FtsB